VLSSIQFYIAKNDRQNAINYLSTFSKLIRSVLNHSITNKVRLSDEVELLRNYVQLELTRFENKFDFVMNLDGVSDFDEAEIPSLLIQPYVENAILHGLYNKAGKGLLSISFISEVNALVVEIEDNGIGREEALKIKQQSTVHHKSMGIKVTEERLKLINQYKNTSFEIIDLKDDHGKAMGTRVKVRIEY
jgi:sensor histidine kinase YesM